MGDDLRYVSVYAQVDIYPLLSPTATHPGTGKMAGGHDVGHLSVITNEIDGMNSPLHRSFHLHENSETTERLMA